MYICKECGEVFEDYAEQREIHDELDGAPYESFAVCPYCGESSFETADECDECGEFFPANVGYICGDRSRLCSIDCVCNHFDVMNIVEQRRYIYGR